MNVVNLNSFQKQLLIRLVNYALKKRINETIVPIPNGPSEYAILVKGESSMRIANLSDLDALCAADVMAYRLNRMGNGKIYYLTSASFEAADQWRIDNYSDREPFAPASAAPKYELLVQLTNQLIQQLNHYSNQDLATHVLEVQEMCIQPITSRSAIAYRLRRIGRHLSEQIRDQDSAQTLIIFGKWCETLFDYVDPKP